MSLLRNKTIFTECLLTPWLRIIFLKVTKNLMEKKPNFLTFWWRFDEAQSPSMPPIWRLFILNLMLNRTGISVWYTDEEKVNKTRAFNRNGKIFLKWRIYPSPIVNGLERHIEKHMHPIFLLKCEVNRCYWSLMSLLQQKQFSQNAC